MQKNQAIENLYIALMDKEIAEKGSTIFLHDIEFEEIPERLLSKIEEIDIPTQLEKERNIGLKIGGSNYPCHYFYIFIKNTEENTKLAVSFKQKWCLP